MPLLSAARRAEVLTWVQAHGMAQVNELADSLGVSASTIRRDLAQMQDEGLLRRVHGGALAGEDEVEPRREARAVSNAPEKARIAAAAAKLVQDGSTILITGGITTEAMVPHLATTSDVSVVTNSLTIASALAEQENLSVIVLGGYLRRNELSLLGHLTRRALDDLSVDATFSGAFGLDREGVTGAHLAEADTDRSLIGGSRYLVVLADASKFGRRGAVRLVSAAEIGTLVTTVGAPDAELQALEDQAVDVVVV